MPPVKRSRKGAAPSQKRGRNNAERKYNAKKKAKHFFAYVCLFVIVFFGALFVFSSAIKSYSPKISTSEIGVNEIFSLNVPEPVQNTKTIDERLKWIQMEDDLPSVSINSKDKAEKYKKFEKELPAEDIDEQAEEEVIEDEEDEEQQDLKPPMPQISEIKKQYENDFRRIPARDVIPLPKRVITKVYLGGYTSEEEARKVQSKIAEALNDGSAPFVKTVNGYYIVQLGSFTDGAKAEAFTEKLRALGYYPKINYEN